MTDNWIHINASMQVGSIKKGYIDHFVLYIYLSLSICLACKLRKAHKILHRNRKKEKNNGEQQVVDALWRSFIDGGSIVVHGHQ